MGLKEENGKRSYLEKDAFVSVHELASILERINQDKLSIFSTEEIPSFVWDVINNTFSTIKYFDTSADFNISNWYGIVVLTPATVISLSARSARSNTASQTTGVTMSFAPIES